MLKGAHTEEQAMAKYEAWLEEKAKMIDKAQVLSLKQNDAAAKALAMKKLELLKLLLLKHSQVEESEEEVVAEETPVEEAPAETPAESSG